ncbi:hypothetical protein PBY51_000837 [Eleginops maclovinus]|uniref:Uncharacterized protein n=1 Tax=Eleginops maclovinus TaxID=56733 RepID=A0AAN7XKN7_ELEMC|nr:hypothetical protein PBY51_000837 [Eleginops maclovinus]
MDKVTAQLSVYTLSVGIFIYSCIHHKDKKGDKELLSHLLSLRSHPSALDLTLEDGCGPVEHALTLDGPRLCCWAVAAGGAAGFIRHTVRLTEVRGLCGLDPKS